MSTLKTIGLGKYIDRVSIQIVDVSGIVVEKSGYIMSDALKKVDFGAGVVVVVGGEDAATQVLREAMKVKITCTVYAWRKNLVKVTHLSTGPLQQEFIISLPKIK